MVSVEQDVSQNVVAFSKNNKLTALTCDRKWRNLLRTYRRIKKNRLTGRVGGRTWVTECYVWHHGNDQFYICSSNFFFVFSSKSGYDAV